LRFSCGCSKSPHTEGTACAHLLRCRAHAVTVQQSR
jgi:hypothetical protein